MDTGSTTTARCGRLATCAILRQSQSAEKFMTRKVWYGSKNCQIEAGASSQAAMDLG